MNLLVLLTILATPNSSCPSVIEVEVQRSRMKVLRLHAEQKLAVLQADQIRELFYQGHSSQTEYIAAVAKLDDAVARRKAQQDYVNAVERLEDETRMQQDALHWGVEIPGFSDHPHLKKVAYQILNLDDQWANIAREQQYVRPPTFHLSSHAWRHRYQQLQTLPPSLALRSEIAELRHKTIIAEYSERLTETAFRPLQRLSSQNQIQIAFLQNLRQSQLDSAYQNRSQRITKLLNGLSNQPALTPVSFSTLALQTSGTDQSVPNSPPTVIDWNNAVSTARERIRTAVKNLSQRKQAAQMFDQTTAASPSTSLHRSTALAAQTVIVAAHELEIRRAEHLYLIGRRNELFSDEDQAYRNWQLSLKRIFELRSANPLIRLATVKVAINQQHQKSIQSIFNDGFATTKENMDAKVKLDRSIWQQNMLRHQCDIYGRIADLL